MREHLGSLIEQLLGDNAYASGRRSFPRTVTREDAATIAEVIHREVDRGVEARAAAAREDGTTIACGRGCNHCCAELVLAYRPEALEIAAWLGREENRAVRERFVAAYDGWLAAIGDAGETLSALVASDPEAYKEAHSLQYRKRIMCAFNVDGDCSIYPVRPAVCRNAHAADTAERCRPEHTGPAPTRLAFVPLDSFLAKARRLERAAHHAVGGPRNRPQALCTAVKTLLA